MTKRHPLAELTTHYQLLVAQIGRWKAQLRQQAAQVLTKPFAAVASSPDMKPLYAASGRLLMER